MSMRNNKYIDIINNFIQVSKSNDITDLFPISKEQLSSNHELCDKIIDYLSDMEMIVGFNKDYSQTEVGKLLSESIDYILRINYKKTGDGSVS